MFQIHFVYDQQADLRMKRNTLELFYKAKRMTHIQSRTEIAFLRHTSKILMVQIKMDERQTNGKGPNYGV